MKIIEWFKDKAIFILMIVLFASPILFVVVYNFQDTVNEIDELRDVIEDMNVSSDYKQGWIDCINYLKHIRMRATNCTVANIR